MGYIFLSQEQDKSSNIEQQPPFARPGHTLLTKGFEKIIILSYVDIISDKAAYDVSSGSLEKKINTAEAQVLSLQVGYMYNIILYGSWTYSVYQVKYAKLIGLKKKEEEKKQHFYK